MKWLKKISNYWKRSVNEAHTSQFTRLPFDIEDDILTRPPMNKINYPWQKLEIFGVNVEVQKGKSHHLLKMYRAYKNIPNYLINYNIPRELDIGFKYYSVYRANISVVEREIKDKIEKKR